MSELSPHFTLEELTASETARKHGIDNSLPVVLRPRMALVCTTILEPVRAHFNRAVRVNSGYRCLSLNRAVGSKDGSQHVVGEAVDFEIDGIANGDVAAWCRDNLTFGQLILEAYTPGHPNSGWVHCSLRTVAHRGDVLTMTPGSHGPVYSRGLHA